MASHLNKHSRYHLNTRRIRTYLYVVNLATELLCLRDHSYALSNNVVLVRTNWTISYQQHSVTTVVYFFHSVLFTALSHAAFCCCCFFHCTCVSVCTLCTNWDNNNNNIILIPWQGGKPLCWDVTVACPVANSYIQTAIGSAGAVAEMAATRKSTKYGALESQYCF